MDDSGDPLVQNDPAARVFSWLVSGWRQGAGARWGAAGTWPMALASDHVEAAGLHMILCAQEPAFSEDVMSSYLWRHGARAQGARGAARGRLAPGFDARAYLGRGEKPCASALGALLGPRACFGPRVASAEPCGHRASYMDCRYCATFPISDSMTSRICASSVARVRAEVTLRRHLARLWRQRRGAGAGEAVQLELRACFALWNLTQSTGDSRAACGHAERGVR